MVVPTRWESPTPVAARPAAAPLSRGPERSTINLTAEHALRQSPYRALHTLSCAVEQGRLTIDGAVPSFFLKQQAQEAVRRAAGRTPVENRVEVA